MSAILGAFCIWVVFEVLDTLIVTPIVFTIWLLKGRKHD